ncbi:hypothetical protein MMC17_005246 [Xylographa soralifera]|nr:hypothetical protein [Xylographa soralifera]
MSSTFKDEVKAYNKAKQPFMELLMATLAKQEQSKETAEAYTPTTKAGAEHDKLTRAKNDEPIARDSEYPKSKSLGLLAVKTPSFPKMDPHEVNPASAIAHMVAAARELSEAGKSKTKKSEWDEIDTLLGFKDYKE